MVNPLVGFLRLSELWFRPFNDDVSTSSYIDYDKCILKCIRISIVLFNYFVPRNARTSLHNKR